MTKPATPIVFGSGSLADAVRARLAADPDRYRPRTSSIDPVGHCPGCGRDVYRVTSKATGWEEGFATGIEDDAIVHPRCNDEGREDPTGTRIGGCKGFDKVAEWAEPGAADPQQDEVRVGDMRQGNGRVAVLVEVIAVAGSKASCKLARTGKLKVITLKTLSTAYRLIRRGSPGEWHDR